MCRPQVFAYDAGEQQLIEVGVGIEQPLARRAPLERNREPSRGNATLSIVSTEKRPKNSPRRKSSSEIERRIADAQIELAVGGAQAEAVFAPGRQLAADGELERRLAQLRFGHALVALVYVELSRFEIERRREEIETLGAERLIQVGDQRGLVADDDRGAPLAAERVDRRAQVARREPEQRVGVGRGAVLHAELQVVRPPRARIELDLEAGAPSSSVTRP